MTERLIGETGSRKRRRFLLLPLLLVSGLALLMIAGAQAQLDRSLFELDKNAHNNITTTKVAVLNSAVSTSATSIQLCQVSAAALANGATILIDAERMTLGAGSSVGGGGCPAGFSNKFNYPVTRAAGGTTAGAHTKAEDVTLIVSGSVDGDDWDQVHALVSGNAGGSDAEKCTSIGAVECVWTADGRAASIFTSSKDYDLIEDWQWRDQSVPDADELDDGFAVKYVDGSGEQHLYFGADRFATNGSKDAGFWFFHDTVAAVPPVGSADGTFEGEHTGPSPGTNGIFCNQAGNTTNPNCVRDADDVAGDILILTTFTNGGATNDVRVFEWIGPGGAVSSVNGPVGAFGDCVPGAASDNGCATVNNTTIESPWAYSGKGEPALNEIASGGFLEGGVNLSALGLDGCFSSFMATTRSSPSLTADPKDFILGKFEACGSTMTTDASSNSFAIGGSVTDSATITVTGGGPAPTGSVNFYVCGPTADIASCDASTGTALSTEALSGATGTPPEYTVTSDSFTPTQAGDYCFFATWAGDGNYPSGASVTNFTDECFEVISLTPSVATAQFFYPNDSATVTVASGGGALAGTIQFRVWTNATCSGAPLYDSGALDVTGGSGSALIRTLETSNVSNRVQASVAVPNPSVYWDVDYDSTNPAHQDVNGACGTEHSTITITNS